MSAPKEQEEEKQRHIVKVKVRHWLDILKTVSVEPAALFMMTSTLMTYLLFQNLLIDNVCRVSRNYSEQVCQEIVNVNATFADEEAEIQKIVAEQKTYRAILDFSFPILFIIFVGPWSDYYGRKIPLTLTIFGTTLSSLVTMICSLYYDTINPFLLILFAAIPRALTGGEVAFSMAAYSYISDRSDHRLRTVRTGILNASLKLGVPLGFALAGMVTKYQLSYIWGFGISAMISCIGLLIILAAVQNQTKADRMAAAGVGIKASDSASSDENFTEAKDDLGFALNEKSPTCWTIIHPRHSFYEVVALPFKKRGHNTRLKIWLLLLVFFCSATPIHGEFQVMYLFVRERLGWNIVQFGNFSTFNWFIGVTGVVLSMGILSKWLKLSDPIVGFVAGLSQLGGCVVYITAINSTMMYLASTVDMMNGTMIVIARSMLSKLVHPDEIGKLFSLIAILDTLIPLGLIPLYTQVYILTVDIFSGYVLIMSAIFTIPPQLIYMWFIWKNYSKRRNNEGGLKQRKITFQMSHPPEIAQS